MDCIVIEASFLVYDNFEGEKKNKQRYLALSNGFVLDLETMKQFKPSAPNT